MTLDPASRRLLRETTIFASLKDSDFEAIIADLRIVSISSGQSLFVEGTPAEAFYVVLDGWIVLSRDQPNGDSAVIHVFGPGESFAEALILPDTVYPVSAEAASDVRVAQFDTRKFRDLFTTNPQLGLAVVSATFRQLRNLVDHIEEIKTWSTRRRVAGILLKLCRHAGGSRNFALPMEQRLIAARLSITPSTLSRTLGDLREQGIRARRGRIEIECVDRLAHFVEGGPTPGDRARGPDAGGRFLPEMPRFS